MGLRHPVVKLSSFGECSPKHSPKLLNFNHSPKLLNYTFSKATQFSGECLLIFRGGWLLILWERKDIARGTLSYLLSHKRQTLSYFLSHDQQPWVTSLSQKALYTCWCCARDVYIYVYIYTYLYIYMYICIDIFRYMYIFIDTYRYIYMYIKNINIWISMYIYIWLYT